MNRINLECLILNRSFCPLIKYLIDHCLENNEILLDYDTAIDTLTSLGLIKLREGQKFVADYYKNQYSMIENKVNSQDWHAALLPGEKLDIRCSNLRTTILGKEFIENIVIDSE